MAPVRRVVLRLIAALVPVWALSSEPAQDPPVVSPTQELVLGNDVVAKFLLERPETADAELASRADAIARRLSGVTDRPDVLHRAIVVKGADWQAFAFPGGTVAVTEALIRVLDDDELAFALAHEMAHVDLRHQVDRVVAEDVVREAAGDSAAAMDAALSIKDRHAEMEADRFGALYAVRAGFQFSAAERLLAKLQAGGVPERDSKHPAYTARIQALRGFETELRRAVEAFDRGCAALKAGSADAAVNYLVLFVASFPQSLAGQVDLGAAYLARWRAGRAAVDDLAEALPILPDPGVAVRGGFNDLDGRNARRHFEAAMRLDPNAAAARIGIAMIKLREGSAAEAREYLRPAVDDPRLRAEVLLLLGNTEYVGGAWASAAEYYEEALRARPGWSAPRANLARTLERDGRAREARELWESLRDDPVWGEEARRRTSNPRAVAGP